MSGKASLVKNLELLGIQLVEENCESSSKNCWTWRFEENHHPSRPSFHHNRCAGNPGRAADRITELFHIQWAESKSVASIRMMFDKKEHIESGSGNGLRCLHECDQKILKKHHLQCPQLLDYQIRIPRGGQTDALTESIITWDMNGKRVQLWASTQIRLWRQWTQPWRCSTFISCNWPDQRQKPGGIGCLSLPALRIPFAYQLRVQNPPPSLLSTGCPLKALGSNSFPSNCGSRRISSFVGRMRRDRFEVEQVIFILSNGLYPDQFKRKTYPMAIRLSLLRQALLSFADPEPVSARLAMTSKVL